jgi:hypothetical protein
MECRAAEPEVTRLFCECPQCVGFRQGLAEARAQVRDKLKSAFKWDDTEGFFQDMIEWSNFTGGGR